MDRWLQRVHGGHKRALVSFLFSIFLLASGQAFGMPAYPGPVFDQQPDGSSVELRIRGDEHFNWTEDANGFTVVRVNGWYQYARLNTSGQLESTGLNVGQADPEAAGLSKGTIPPASVRAQSALVMPQATPDAVPPVGTVKNLVVLMRFSDHVGRTPPSVSDIDTLMNSPVPVAGIAPSGSVRGVYFENSYGQMTLESTVATWVVLPNTEAYYANGNSGLTSRTHDALKAALDLVDALPGINFDDFDTDNDNQIDSITFLHSGYAAEFGGTDAYGTNYVDRMWSHRWSIFGGWTSSSGVQVSDYHISPAVWGTSGNALGRIGVISHETGHFFGITDLYDSDSSGGEGIGSWGMMANSWGFDGTQYCPPHFSPWSKIELGWTTPTVISNPGQYSLNEVEFNPEIYRIDSGFPSNEYLLIENRQPSGFEYCMPQGGLVIWHIDDDASYTSEGYPGQGGWPGNGNHYRVAVLQADGNYNLEKGNNRGDSGDPHHAAGVDAIGPGPGGHPNTDTYQGGVITQTGITISDISASGSSMTFCLNGCNGLAAPSSLSATAVGTSQVDLSWTDNSGGDETGFSIQRSLDGTNFSPLTDVGANVTSHSDLTASAGTTYYYRVRAFDATDTSGWSNVANATTTDSPPNAPSNLIATANGQTRIDLVWTDGSTNEDLFRVKRSTSETSGFVTVDTTAADVTSFSDLGLSPSTTYYYRIFAVNSGGESTGFAAGNARTDDPPPVQTFVAYADQFGSGLVNGTYVNTHTGDGVNQWIEEKVSGGKKRDRTTYMGHFWRFNIASGNEIRVYANAYQSNSGDGDNFLFSWSDDDSTYHDLFTVSSESGSNDEMAFIPPSVSGEVWIRVIDTDRTPGNSSSRDRIYVDHLYIEVENFGPPTVPADPDNLQVTGVGFTNIDIAWDDNSNNEDLFKIERSDDGLSGWTQIDTVVANVNTYSDTGLANGVTRHYRVRAWNGVGNSGYSNSDSGTTNEPEPPPATPTIVSAVANAYNSITVNWVDNSNNETGFRIRRSLDVSNWSIVAAIGTTDENGTGGAESWEDTTVAAEMTYYYQVQAYNSVDSAWTASVNATTPEDPNPATLDLAASGFKNKGKKNFNLSWTPADGGSVEVFLDGNSQGTTADDGSHSFGTNLKGGGSHDLQVCQTEAGGLCSNIAVVSF